ISGPQLDRIDLHVEIQPVPFDKLSGLASGESSASIRERVLRARAVQEARYADEPSIHCNAQLSSRLMARHCVLGPDAMAIVKLAMEKYDMSARAYDRILKVARTIADLDGSESILARHVSEAVGYRTLDKASWGHGY
ncbi:MAG: magnesium chelatase, partial [Muribaculaceae bacterium]|nr:magnesium chelatase [Muribaculaceae bacterium]